MLLLLYSLNFFAIYQWLTQNNNDLDIFFRYRTHSEKNSRKYRLRRAVAATNPLR